SSGPCDFPMPAVTSSRRAQAINTLTDAGIPRENISFEECDADDPKGTVVEQNPIPGTPVGTDTEVTLCVSDGPTKVPDVVGKTRAQAEKLIRDAGFNPIVRNADASDDSQPKGRITEQLPAAG